MKNNKGITLVILITTVVLLILLGSIAVYFAQDEEILDTTNNAREKLKQKIIQDENKIEQKLNESNQIDNMISTWDNTIE